MGERIRVSLLDGATSHHNNCEGDKGFSRKKHEVRERVSGGYRAGLIQNTAGTGPFEALLGAINYTNLIYTNYRTWCTPLQGIVPVTAKANHTRRLLCAVCPPNWAESQLKLRRPAGSILIVVATSGLSTIGMRKTNEMNEFVLVTVQSTVILSITPAMLENQASISGHHCQSPNGAATAHKAPVASASSHLSSTLGPF